MKIVVIEDEKLTAKDLAKLIQQIAPESEILAILSSVEEAVLFFEKHVSPPIELIFSDIELGDGLSFEIFHQMPHKIPIIFCTAYDQYSLEAFHSFGIDYVLKPFNRASIERTLLKYQQLKEQFASPAPDYALLLAALKGRVAAPTPSVIVYQADRIIPISGEEIALFGIEHEQPFALTFGLKKHAVGQQLDQLESKFSPLFFRANRQFLVNRKAVKEAQHYANRKLVIALTVPYPEPILVGKLKVSAFLQWLSEA